MKIRLTPQLAYIIGLWKTRRTKEGIGIAGGRKIVEVFLKKIIDAKIAQPDKIQIREVEMLVDKEGEGSEKWKSANLASVRTVDGKNANVATGNATDAIGVENKPAFAKKIRRETDVYFYNSAYRAYFDEVCKNAADIFVHKNEYAAQYLAGMFDGCGGVHEADGTIYLSSGSTRDEMVLLRLGFRAKKIRGKIVVLKPDPLVAFIKPYANYFMKGEK
jgi:hypothetical protein